MKKNIKHHIAFIIVFIIIFLPDTLFAENITMTAVGEYVMGDNDTYIEAKKLALQDAKRILLEKVGTYIESKTEVKDGIVKSDEIKQYTAGIVKVEEVSDERSVLANKASVVKVHVKAIVDPDALIKQVISFRNRKDVEESAKKTSADNYKLRKEIEHLNQQLRSVADEKKYQQLSTQRKEILEQIDTNEKGLILILSGEGLYTAALLDRQKKDEVKRKVKIFLRGMAAAYKLSASPLVVNDNGDDTANVTFTVRAQLSFNDLDISDISSIGINFIERGGFRSLIYGNTSDTRSKFSIQCGPANLRLGFSDAYRTKDKICEEAVIFMHNELGLLDFSVKLGTFEDNLGVIIEN